VANERCAFTNLSWVIDAAAARQQLRTPAVRVVNDFEAVGYGIASLDPGSVLTLNAGQPMCAFLIPPACCAYCVTRLSAANAGLLCAARARRWLCWARARGWGRLC
jgi:hypothetical protein